MPTINLPATPPTFQEYQLIHQTQQRQRYPELADKQKPATSDPWKRKVWLWLGLLGAAVGYCIWFGPAGGVGYLVLTTLLTILGLLYQWWEYRRAFRMYQKQPRPLNFQVSESGLAVQWPQGWQRLPWPSLARVQQISDWLLLYPGPDFAYYLDLRRVQVPYTAIDVLALIGKGEKSGPAAIFAS